MVSINYSLYCWMAYLGANVLSLRGLVTDMTYLLCNELLESTSHLFFDFY